MRNEVRVGKPPPAIQPINGRIVSVGKEDALGMIGFCENNHDGQLSVQKSDEPAEPVDYQLMSTAMCKIASCRGTAALEALAP